ncbi:MAG: DUF1353 domain-containing protein [Actinomycetota bacterium]|nr:DUF1353 domain-containing protein [Actinomycetota bacterium]
MAGEGFFDAESPGMAAPARILLERHEVDGIETFQIVRRFGFHDPGFEQPFIVPADIETFRSDLTSVPVLFTWLVPRTGNHLPAALLHDGLVYTPDEPASYIGPAVTREQADGIFRNAMADLGTGWVRRWLVWTAVILATALTELRPRWRWVPVIVGTLVAVSILGVLATIDLLDVCTVLPWMGERGFWREVAGGTVSALAIPLVLSLLWGRLFKAGIIACVALAFLLHVTVVLALLSGVYQFVESPRTALATIRKYVTPAVLAGIVAYGGVIGLILWWRCP